MINRILESKFRYLDSVYSLLNEDANIESVLDAYDQLRETPLSLYRQIQQLFLDPTFGLYLSPASLVKQRTVAYNNKVEQKIAEFKEMGERGDLEARAREAVDNEMRNVITTRALEIMKEHKVSFDEAKTRALREAPDLVGVEFVPSLKSLTIYSQRSGASDVFARSDLLGVEETTTVRPETLDTYHDPLVSRMVRLGGNSPLPPRLKKESKATQDKINELKGRINEFRKIIDDPHADEALKDVAPDELAVLENELAIQEYNLAQMSTNGAWSSEDLNILCYGSSPPPPIKSREEYKQIKREKVVGTSGFAGGEALLPNLYYDIVRDDGGGGHLDYLIKNTKNEHRKKQLKIMREHWLDSGGDLTKISDDLYAIVVRYVVDRLNGIKSRFEAEAKSRGIDIDRNKRGELKYIYSDADPDDRRLMQNILDFERMTKMETTDAGNKYYDLQIGSKIYRRRERGKWDDEPMVVQDRDQDVNHRELKFDVDMTSNYNLASLLKRVTVAEQLMESVDKSVVAWVTGKVGDALHRLVDYNHAGILNIGTGPELVNKFLGDIDLMEQRYGIDTKMSWQLVGFMEAHINKANVLFEKAKDFYANPEQVINSVSEVSHWSTGLLDRGSEVPYRDRRTGRVINVKGKSADHYYRLAIAYLSEKGEFDLYEDAELSQEIDGLLDNANKNVQQIDRLSKQTEASVDDNEKSKILIEIERLKDEIEKIKSQVSDLKLSRDDQWQKVFDFAATLQDNNVESLEDFKRSPLYPEAFEAWLRASGEDKELNRIEEELDNTEDWQARSELKKQRRQELNRLKKLYREQIKQQEGGQEKQRDPDKQKKITQLLHIYADYDNKRLAELASKRLGETVDESDIEIIRGKPSRKNMISFLLNAIRQHVRSKVATDDRDAFSKEARRLMTTDESCIAFVAAIKESAIAMIERMLIESSQTRIYGGGGVKTGAMSYVDEHGVARSLPGYDVGEAFGDRVNPIRLIAQKRLENDDLRNAIESMNKKMGDIESRPLPQRKVDRDEQLEKNKKEIAELKAETDKTKERIKSNRFEMEEYKIFMDEHPAMKRMALRAESIKLGKNPYHPRNKEAFEALRDKIKRKIAGEEIEINVDEQAMIRFLHRHIPLLQSMGVVGATIAARYTAPYKRSIDTYVVDGEARPRQSIIDEIDAAENTNIIRDALSYVKAGRHMNILFEEMKNSNLDNKLKEMGAPKRILLDIAMQLAFWANGPVVRNSLTTDEGRKLSQQKLKKVLFEYFIDYEAVAPLIDQYIDSAAGLSVPDEKEMELDRTLYENTAVYLQEMLAGETILTANGEDLPYSSSDTNVVLDFLSAIQTMKEAGDESGIKKHLERFMDFVTNLDMEKDANEVFAEVVELVGDISRLDNLTYLFSKYRYLHETMKKTKDVKIRDSLYKQMDDIEAEIRVEITKLGDDSVQLVDIYDMQHMLEIINQIRKTKVDRIEAFIGRYSEIDIEIAAKLRKFKKLIDVSRNYQDAKLKLDSAVGDDKEAAEEVDKYGSILNKAKMELQFEFGDKATEMSKEYRERVHIYDKLIRQRNAIVGKSHANNREFKEVFDSILKTLVMMTKKYSKDASEVLYELLTRVESHPVSSYVRARRMVKRAKEKIAGKTEMVAQIQLVDHGEEVDVRLYVDGGQARALNKLKLLNLPIAATLMRPNDFFAERGKSVAVFRGVEVPKGKKGKDYGMNEDQFMEILNRINQLSGSQASIILDEEGDLGRIEGVDRINVLITV